MTEFPTIILTQVQPDFEFYEVYEDCKYDDHLTIPKGFQTDFASIPKFLWGLMAPHQAAAPASVLHDYFYTDHPLGLGGLGMSMKEERLFADKLFRDILIEHGVSKFQAGVMYNAVRLFGKFRFEHNGRSRKRVRLDKKLEESRAESQLNLNDHESF